MASQHPSSNDDKDEPSPVSLDLTSTTESLLNQFDTALRQTSIKNSSWLKNLMDEFIISTEWTSSSDSNTSGMKKLSPTLVLDYIFLRVVKDGKTFGKRDLWTYALVLNRTNTPRNDTRFTRVKFIFRKVIAFLGKRKARPPDIAELEVIRIHLGLHLNLKEDKPDETLALIGSELEFTYSKIFSNKKELNTLPQSWSSLVNVLLSKTSFEEIYPTDEAAENSSSPKFSLFLMNGKKVGIKPPALVERPHPSQNVIEINDPGDVREAFIMFMEQFLLIIENPPLSPGLMRSMILIIVDLVDVAILYKLETFSSLFGAIKRDKNMGEPNLFCKRLFKLWIWVGVMSNPVHNRGKNGIKAIRRMKGKLALSPNENPREAELTELKQRVSQNEPGVVSDFHSFLELLDKFYPRRSKRESRTMPCNELEEMYLNLRLHFAYPPPFFFSPHFVKQRLCATAWKYCSRLRVFRDSAIERMEVEEICSVCDSSSDEENEECEGGKARS